MTKKTEFTEQDAINLSEKCALILADLSDKHGAVVIPAMQTALVLVSYAADIPAAVTRQTLLNAISALDTMEEQIKQLAKLNDASPTAH